MDKLESGLPDTFDAALNGANHWPDIDNGVALYRLETTSFALRDSGIDEAELDRAVKAFTGTVAADKAAARTVLERVTDTWNEHRDRRPLFATTHDEIVSVLDAAGDDWANALRDQLGLGHFNPEPGRPVAVLLMRYTVREVRDCKAAGTPAFCIPTVLDGTVNPYFCPTPLPGPAAAGRQWQMGRAINLAATTESDYAMRAELVHSYLDYRPEHLARVGLVSRQMQCDLAQLRAFHLNWLRLELDRDPPQPFDTDLSHV